MKGEFVPQEKQDLRELKGWEAADSKNALNSLLEVLAKECQAQYEIEGRLVELQDALAKAERQFTTLVLGILEAVDFWESVMEVEDLSAEDKVDRLLSGYRLLMEELAKKGVQADGPLLGDLPRRGKDVVEASNNCEKMPPGTVCRVVKKCYCYQERVLRKATVITARKKEE